MYIEPCCADRQLEPIVNQSFGYFQTSGDVKVDKLMSALSQWVPSAVCVLVIPKADVYLLRKLNTYIVKSWYSGVVLLTAENQTELVRAEFCNNINRVYYAHHRHVVDGQMALTNFGKHLLVNGPMLTENDFSICNYTLSVGNDSVLFKSGLDAVVPKLRLNATIECSDDDIVKLLKWEF